MSKNVTAALLRDSGSERTLLATVVKYGKDAYIDSSGIVSPTDFGLPINRAIYSAVEKLAEENCETFDIETVKMKMNTLGFGEYTKGSKDQEYLELLRVSN